MNYLEEYKRWCEDPSFDEETKKELISIKDDEEEIVSIQKNAEKDFGFDAKTGDWVNMFEAGIIDPTKVTRSALLNAASISALFLTTEAGVAELPKKEESQQPVMPQGGMY